MKKHIIYHLMALLFIAGACQNEEKTQITEVQTPPMKEQLVNWSAMNRSGWKNMSFPVWFSPKLIDSLGIDHVVLEFTNFNFTDTSLTVSDTLPYQKILIDFRPKGEVQKVVMKEMSSGVEIGEFIFSYQAHMDSFGYSAPAVSSNVKYRKSSMLSLFNTFQELQQYQRLVLVESDSSFLNYLDKSSKEEVHHYFILDSSYWNVSFIDQSYTPKGKNIFYYGSPKDYISSFALVNLVEKSMNEEKTYYPTKVLKSQSFYMNDFVTERHYTYDSTGRFTGFLDSLKTSAKDFLHLEIAEVIYHNDLPNSLLFFNEEDTLKSTPIKRIQFHYEYEK